MPQLFSYISKPETAAFCDRINMLPELAEQTLNYMDKDVLSPAAPYFDELFSLTSSEEAIKAVAGLFTDDPGSSGEEACFKALAVLLAAMLRTRELYIGKGIDLSVYYATMAYINRMLTENHIVSGRYNLDRGAFWISKHLLLSVFRLGTLDFEMLTISKEVSDLSKGRLYEGERVISVHIPSDAVLTRESLDRTYKMCYEFFRKFFPGFTYDKIYCHSWLMSPDLKYILQDGSRILEFQSDYELVYTSDDSSSCLFWLFYKDGADIDYNSLPENTSLRKAAKKRLLDGGKVRSGIGIIN